MKTKAVIKNIPLPPPRWFRVTNEIISYTEDFVIAFLMLKGHQADSFYLLAFKLASSFVRKVLRAILVGDDRYVPVQMIEADKAA